MRISVHQDDPGYRAFCEIRFAHVYLDGVHQPHCLMADEERGEVEVLVTSANGDVFAGFHGEALTDIKRGAVDVIPADVNFDAWFAARLERAHAALMAGPSYRGCGHRAN